MSLLPNLRRSVAMLVLAAGLIVALPAIGTAGGCDEPGYTGGNCLTRGDCDPLPIGPVPTRPELPEDPSLVDASSLATWLAAILSGLIL